MGFSISKSLLKFELHQQKYFKHNDTQLVSFNVIHKMCYIFIRVQDIIALVLKARIS